MDEMTNDGFREWLSDVDALCRRRLGVRLDDLPDLLTRDAWDGGATPEEFFEEEVMPLVREEFGCLAGEVDD